MRVTVRDTDADWRAIGATEPFWGVLGAPQYKMANLDADRIKEFYATGPEHIRNVIDRLERIVGDPIRVARALDFGCGAGRLAEAMAPFADQVVGLDVSAEMLNHARRHGAGSVLYCDTLPEGFQHIPPRRGAAILETLLDRLEPDGMISRTSRPAATWACSARPAGEQCRY
jgi:SAM-dependent methyltransferase